MSTFTSGISHYASRTQAGMALLLCLIFLMALMLLGLSAASDTVLQNKLAGNLQESERAKQSALLALSWAEHWLLKFDGPAPETCSEPCDGLFIHAVGNLPDHPEFENHAWWLGQGHEVGIDPFSGERITTISSDSVNAPVWIIEAVHTIPPIEGGTPDTRAWYRVLARGSGRTEAAVSVVESIIVRSWPPVEDNESSNTLTTVPCPGSEAPAICGRFSWRELR